MAEEGKELFPSPIQPTETGGPKETELPRSEILQTRAYPMEEELWVDLLASTEIGKDGDISDLNVVVRNLLAFKEGLTYGISGYDLKDPDVILKLQNDFTTVEESIQRPQAPYLDPALKKAIRGRVQEAKIFGTNKALWERMIEAKYPEPTGFEYEYLRIKDEESRALKLRVDRKRRAERIQRLREGFERTNDAENDLIALENRIDARRILDAAFRVRMATCEDPTAAAKVIEIQANPTPDKGHWKALFKGEFGQGLDKVLRKMVDVAYTHDGYIVHENKNEPPERISGIPQTSYVDGFETTGSFENWLKLMYEESGERMDVVWEAWRIALTWEVINEFGKKIGPKGEFKLAPPPLGSSLFTWAAHPEEKRAIEFGLKADGKRGDRVDRYVSHSGLPMSLSRFPTLCRSFLHNSKIKVHKHELEKWGVKDKLATNIQSKIDTLIENQNKLNYGDTYKIRLGYELKDFTDLRDDLKKVLKGKKVTDTVEISLFDLWRHGGLSFADENFPWSHSEQLSPDVPPGELSPGSFGGWILRRSRAWGVVSDIRSRPDIGSGGPDVNFGHPDFFAHRLRNWGKVMGAVKDIKEGDKNYERNYIPPEKNPRAWWVAGLIRYHMGGTGKRTKITDSEPMKDYRTLVRSQGLEARGEGLAQNIGYGDVFRHAKNCGFLREIDIVWIKKQLSI